MECIYSRNTLKEKEKENGLLTLQISSLSNQIRSLEEVNKQIEKENQELSEKWREKEEFLVAKYEQIITNLTSENSDFQFSIFLF